MTKKFLGVFLLAALSLWIVPDPCLPRDSNGYPERRGRQDRQSAGPMNGTSIIQVRIQNPKVVKRAAPVRLQPWNLWCDAAWEGTSFAVGMWVMQAHFRDIRIDGPKAVGAPGCLTGPSLKTWVRAKMVERKVPDAVADKFAEGIASAWAYWQSGISVPGLPWYPTFSAFPGPTAPPTPNIPCPLSSLPSSNGAAVANRSNLAQKIIVALGEEAASEAAQNAIGEFAKKFADRFTLWTLQVTVEKVLGQGAVPTFHPPYVMSGPVVNGHIIPSPPHFRCPRVF
jgi:hypothetical protein